MPTLLQSAVPPLRLLRRRAMLTQVELAGKSGVGAGTIVRIETGERVSVRTSTMRRIAAALGVEPLDVDEFRAAVERER